jgi:hypothetical protein
MSITIALAIAGTITITIAKAVDGGATHSAPRRLPPVILG